MTSLHNPPVDAQSFKTVTTKAWTGFMSVHELYVCSDDQ